MNTYNLALKDLTVDTIYTVNYKGTAYQMRLVKQTKSGNETECDFVNTSTYLYDPMTTLILGSNDTNIKNGTVTVQALKGKNLNFDIDGDITQTGEYLSSKDVLQLMDNNKNGGAMEKFISNIDSSIFSDKLTAGYAEDLLPKAPLPFVKYGGMAIPTKKLFTGRNVYMVHGPAAILVTIIEKKHNGRVVVRTNAPVEVFTIHTLQGTKFYRKEKYALSVIRYRLQRLSRISARLWPKRAGVITEIDSMSVWGSINKETSEHNSAPKYPLDKTDYRLDFIDKTLLKKTGGKVHQISEPSAAQIMAQHPCAKQLGISFLNQPDDTGDNSKGRGFKAPYISDLSLADMYISQTLKGLDKDVD